MILGIVRVEGRSLEPGLRPGDFLLVSALPYRRRRPAPGEVVVLRHPVYGTLVKRVAWARGDELYVVGDAPDSVDSRRFGPVPGSWVVGKALLRISRPGRNPRRGAAYPSR